MPIQEIEKLQDINPYPINQNSIQAQEIRLAAIELHLVTLTRQVSLISKKLNEVIDEVNNG